MVATFYILQNILVHIHSSAMWLMLWNCYNTIIFRILYIYFTFIYYVHVHTQTDVFRSWAKLKHNQILAWANLQIGINFYYRVAIATEQTKVPTRVEVKQPDTTSTTVATIKIQMYANRRNLLLSSFWTFVKHDNIVNYKHTIIITS